jgi:hypothetical protein
MLRTVRFSCLVVLASSACATLIGCSKKTPGIDTPLTAGGTKIQCLSAERTTSLPGRTFKMKPVDGKGPDIPADRFNFILVKANVEHQGAAPFDAFQVRLEGAEAGPIKPFEVSQLEQEGPVKEWIFTYVILVDRRGPFKLYLSDGQTIPLDKWLKP